MDSMSDEFLLHIFKYLDLKTRLIVAKTCQRWRRLIYDPEAAFDDDISEVRLDRGEPYGDSTDDANASTRSVLAHFDRRVRLYFASEFVRSNILVDQEMHECLNRFEKFVFMPMDPDFEARSSYWPHLPRSMKHLAIDEIGEEQFDLHWLSESLQTLELTLYDLDHLGEIELLDEDDPQPTSIVLPSELKSLKLTGSPSCCVGYLLRYVQLTPSLVELHLHELDLDSGQLHILRLLRLIRDELPNLECLRLSKCSIFIHEGMEEEDQDRFDEGIEAFRREQFMVSIKRIEFDCCYYEDSAQLAVGIKTVLRFSTFESVSFRARLRWILAELSTLTPVIVEKAATLQLSIISPGDPPPDNDPPDPPYAIVHNDMDNVQIPTELSSILTKIELKEDSKAAHYPKLFRPMFIGQSFDLLTEMRLEFCKNLGDVELAIVAEWCKSLELLVFQPDEESVCSVLTDQCLMPFLEFWDERRSKHLAIECLKPSAPFRGFNLSKDKDTGSFSDGKRWARYRKVFPADGLQPRLEGPNGAVTLAPLENGTRLAIWDTKGKSMIITDYKRNGKRSFKITLTDEGCSIVEKREDDLQ